MYIQTRHALASNGEIGGGSDSNGGRDRPPSRVAYFLACGHDLAGVVFVLVVSFCRWFCCWCRVVVMKRDLFLFHVLFFFFLFPRYPKNTQLLLGAALSETRMNEPDKARDYFRRAVEVKSVPVPQAAYLVMAYISCHTAVVVLLGLADAGCCCCRYCGRRRRRRRR